MSVNPELSLSPATTNSHVVSMTFYAHLSHWSVINSAGSLILYLTTLLKASPIYLNQKTSVGTLPPGITSVSSPSTDTCCPKTLMFLLSNNGMLVREMFSKNQNTAALLKFLVTLLLQNTRQSMKPTLFNQ